MVNLDVLHTVLLSLHPTKNLGEYKLSDFTMESLAELQYFHNLILLGPHTGCDGQGARYYTLQTAHCTEFYILPTAHCRLCTVHCTLHIAHYTLQVGGA